MHGRQRGQRLHQRLRRAARLGGDDEARASRDRRSRARIRASRGRGCRRSGCADGCLCASSAMPGMFQPPSCASVWPPRLEPPVPKKMMARAPRAAWRARPRPQRCRPSPRGCAGAAAAGCVVVLQAPTRRRQPRRATVQLGLAQAVLADGAVEAAGDRMPVGRRPAARQSWRSWPRPSANPATVIPTTPCCSVERYGRRTQPARPSARRIDKAVSRAGAATLAKATHPLASGRAAAEPAAHRDKPRYPPGIRPLGLPTTVTISSWPSNSRLATRLISSSVTASISLLRRST